MKKLLLTLGMIATLAISTNAGNIVLNLTQPTTPESFSYNATKGYWTETYNDADYTWIESQVFKISHLIGGAGSSYSGSYWDGFTVGTNGDITNYENASNWIVNQWGCMAGGGIATDENGEIQKDINGNIITTSNKPYLIANWGYYTENSQHSNIIKFVGNKSYKAIGVYICSHPWPYYGNLYGDGYARALNQEGDYFKVIAHGLDANASETGSVDFVLAEYKDGTLTQNNTWQWMDLSSLGTVASIYFTVETTDTGTYGPNAAMYFCMDKLTVNETETQITETTELGVYRIKNTLYNLPIGASIEVYTISGQVIFKGKATNNTLVLPEANNSFFITKVSSEEGIQIIK